MLIQDYQEQWVNDFDRIKKTLEENISSKDIQIEHIGSTSVKNLAAKPIIDIDIIYEKPALFNQIKKGLKKMGYFHNGDQGIEGREVFKLEGRGSEGSERILLKRSAHFTKNKLLQRCILRTFRFSIPLPIFYVNRTFPKQFLTKLKFLQLSLAPNLPVCMELNRWYGAQLRDRMGLNSCMYTCLN